MDSQEVTAEKPNVTVVRGENATLKWLLKKDSLHNLIKVDAYRGDRPNESLSLFDFNGQLTKFSANFFKNRLSGEVSANQDKYELTITDVQYPDTGSFNVDVFFSGGNVFVQKTVTIILIVTGSYLIF